MTCFFIFVLVSETFEINGNELTGPMEIDFDTEMPGMTELTVSFWVQLSGTMFSSPGIYIKSDTRQMSLRFLESETSPSGIEFKVWMYE